MKKEFNKTLSIVRIGIGIVAISSLLATTTACNQKSTGKSILTATVAGRQIQAVIDGPSSIQPESDKALIHSTLGVVAVWQDRVLLDGVELAALPSAATNIEVVIQEKEIKISADGKAVITKQLAR